MARGETLLFGPLGWSVVATATNGISAATKAGVAGFQHVISGVSLSASAAPTAIQTVTLKDGSTVLEQWELPVAAFAAIMFDFKRPYVITAGANAVLSMPALGVAVVGTVVLRGMTASA